MNGAGDALLALPALRALCTLAPEGLTLITSSGSANDPFESLPLRKLIRVRKWREGERVRFDVPLALALAGRPRVFVSMVPWNSPDLRALTMGLNAPESVGFTGGCQTILPTDFTKHSAELTFDVARYFDPRASLVDYAARPTFSNAADQFARSVRRALPPGAMLVALHCDTQPSKMWPLDRFSKVASWLLRRWPQAFAFQLGSIDSEPLSVTPAARYVHAVGFSLEAAYALLASADLFVGIDSCMLHAADFSRVPTVGLFGPTEPAEWGCLFAPHRTLKAPDMRAIDVREVCSAIANLGAERKLARSVSMASPIEATKHVLDPSC